MSEHNQTLALMSEESGELNHPLYGGEGAQHLLFESRGVLWGVEAGAVREVLLLPEIAPIDGAPWWVGVLDVRGQIVPILEPGELAGAASRQYQTTDSVIIIDTASVGFGIIVEGVRDVRGLYLGENQVAPAGMVAGLGRADGEIVRVLNLSFLAQFAARENLPREAAPARSFGIDATPTEQAVFHARARALRSSATATSEEANAPTLVAVRIGGELFGLELEWVREFAERPALTPVPGAPNDLLGLVNLRGEVVPLLDLRPALGLAANENAGMQITFVECEGVHLGVAVEEVLDVFAPQTGELLPPPAASGLKSDTVRAAVFYGQATLAVLDLRNLLQQGGWTTREGVLL